MRRTTSKVVIQIPRSDSLSHAPAVIRHSDTVMVVMAVCGFMAVAWVVGFSRLWHTQQEEDTLPFQDQRVSL